MRCGCALTPTSLLSTSTSKEVCVAANRQQGGYLAVFVIAFTALPAGLIALANRRPIIGVLLALAGMALLIHSLTGFYRVKRLEFTRQD